MNREKKRIISTHLLGNYSLSAADMNQPEDTAAEIWRLLQNSNPDWFEEDGSFVAENVTIIQYDLVSYIFDEADAAKELCENYRYGEVQAGL